MSGRPRPIVLSFLVCRYLSHDRRTGEHSVCGVLNQLTSHSFPASANLSLFAELTDGQGDYQVRFELRDNFDSLLQEFPFPEPIQLPDPLVTHFLCGVDRRMVFPRPGRYDFVLLIDGEEVARRKVAVQPPAPPPNRKPT